MHVFANDAVRFIGRERDVARHLVFVMSYAPGAETERCWIVVAGLNRKLRPINRSAVKPRWRSGF
jgi:hypothetical protein